MHVENVTDCNAGCQEAASVAPEVNLRNPRKNASEGSTLALKPRTAINRSPNGFISGPTKGFVSSKNFFKKRFFFDQRSRQRSSCEQILFVPFIIFCPLHRILNNFTNYNPVKCTTLQQQLL